MQRVVSLALAVTIFSCPALCALGRCSEAGDAKFACCCCHKDSSERGSCPTKSKLPAPSKGCQCICGGALVIDAAEAAMTLDVQWHLAVAILPTIAVSQMVVDSPLGELLMRDDGVNVGRSLCALYSTMQC